MVRKPKFNFPASRQVLAPRPGTLRAQCEALLKRRAGVRLEDVEALVRIFDTSHDREPHNVHRRAYELVRIMHFSMGHGLQDVNGRIRIVDDPLPPLERPKYEKKLRTTGHRNVRKAPARKR